MSQSMSGVRSALLAACTTLFADEKDTSTAPVLVCLGEPGSYQPDYIVAVAMDMRQPLNRPTFGATREREAEIDIVFSTYVPGDESSAATCADACDALVEIFEVWLRANKELGGVATDARATNINGPTIRTIEHPESNAVTGRVATSTLTVTARIDQGF